MSSFRTIMQVRLSTIIVAFIVLLMIVLSASYCYFVWRSINYHSDAAFFLEFAARSSDKQLSNQYSVSPYGVNWLGWQGFEGEPNIHYSVHLEPIKYIYSFLYLLWPNPIILFYFVAIVYFLPLLYFHSVYIAKDKLDVVFKWTCIIAYVSYPSVLNVVSFDLRTYIFLVPFWFLAFLAVHNKRPLWEVLLFFNLMFLAREESIVFGLFLVLYTALNRRLNRAHAKILFVSWFLWTMATIVYFSSSTLVLQHSLSSIIERILGLIQMPIVFGLTVSSVVVIMLMIIFKRRSFNKVLPLLIFSLVLIPVFFPFFSSFFGQTVMSGVTSLLLWPRWMLGIICLLMIIIVAWSITLNVRGRIIFVLLFATIVICVATLSVFMKESAPRSLIRHASSSHNNSWLFELAQQLDKYNAAVLTDYVTYIVFSAFEQTYVYERLPQAIVPKESGNWPMNKPVLTKLLRDEMDYIAISRVNWPAIRDMLEDLDTVDDWVEIYINDTFIVLKIDRSR